MTDPAPLPPPDGQVRVLSFRPRPERPVEPAALARRLRRALVAHTLTLTDQADGAVRTLHPPFGVLVRLDPQELEHLIRAVERPRTLWERLFGVARDLAATIAFVTFVGLAASLVAS